jgi:hypothetical protein
MRWRTWENIHTVKSINSNTEERSWHKHIRRMYMYVHINKSGVRGSVVVEALCYKLEGHGFETRWGEWKFPVFLILPAALGPGVYSASDRNEYQKQKNNVSGE